MEREFRYILSTSFDYDKLICSDAGPAWAARHGFQCVRLHDGLPGKDQTGHAYIVDNRIHQSEQDAIAKLIQRCSAVIILKIVDDCWETISQPYLQFLLTLQPKFNLFFLSPYFPREIANLIARIHGKDRMLHLPYAYMQDDEINAHMASRKRKVAISGALSKGGYPARWEFYINSRRRLFAFNMIAYLSHPGYPDIGLRGKSSTIGTSYIDWLSQYMFMLVTPGRIDYELLKYGECALAGCVPVGILPSSMPSFLPCISTPDHSLKDVFHILKSISVIEAESMACEYRKWFRENRNPTRLKEHLKNQISRVRID